MPFIKSEQDPWVGECLHKIMKESEEQKLGNEDCCKNIFALMLIHIFRNCVAEKNIRKPRSKKNRDGYLRIDSYRIIDSYFDRVFDCNGCNLCIEGLAEELHTSTRHVNRLLHARYGITFREKLLDTRMKFAAYLLKSTDQTIAEIANLCGYTVTYTPPKNGLDADDRGRPFCIRHAEVRYATYHKGMPEAVSMRIEMFV